MTNTRSLSEAPRRGTLSPARRLRAALASSGCGTAARCSLVSGFRCPCPAGSSPPPPPTTAPRLGFVPFSPRSSGPGSSSCCVPAAGPTGGVWPGMTLAVAWRRPPRQSPSSPSPASSAWRVEAGWLVHYLETEGGKSILGPNTLAHRAPARRITDCCGWCISSCVAAALRYGCSALVSCFGFAF